jgi:virginiamycin B lyase
MVWVTDAELAELLRVDPATNTVVSRTKLDKTPCELRFAFGSLWVVTHSGVIDRVDPATGRVVARIRVGLVSYDVAAGGGSIWVTNREGQTVQRIDPARNRVVKTVRFPRTGKPAGVTWAAGAVWIGDDYGNSIYRLNPRTSKLVPVRSGGSGASWVVASGSTVWVSNTFSGSVTRSTRAGASVSRR